MKDKIRTIELFAGVGGFRVGLENINKKNNSKIYDVVWSNQWEPSTKGQHASDIYVKRFGKDNHSNEDIATVEINDIPDFDLMVGGFPCQDYSVASTLNKSGGLQGKKGVLWWQIHRILEGKGKKAPNFLMLENVDRLLKSPAKQRGRDFAIMLASLSDLGYIVEWRVINAAEYGMPQRRRRTFILAYKSNTTISKKIMSNLDNPADWILDDGVMAKAFPVIETKKDKPIHENYFSIDGELDIISNEFKGDKNKSPFENTGIMINRKVYTIKTTPKYDGPFTRLGDILIEEGKISEEFFIKPENLKKWEYLKGAKNEPRKTKDGHVYNYSEGAMIFPDPLDNASRTIVTGEGGAGASRFKHVIKTESGRLRRLTPIELERLNMFPDNHTEGATDVKRAFFMGNALVVGIIEKLGEELKNFINDKST